MYLWVFHSICLNDPSKLGMQRYHFFRSDPENSEYKPYNSEYKKIRSDTAQFLFFYFFINVEFLYFCMLTWSSLFCVLNTINLIYTTSF